MEEENFGEDNAIILQNFRKLCKGYSEQLKAAKNEVFHLLGKHQAYSSGIFRESLIKNFLRGILPSSVSVDSGFIYGFEHVRNSAQLDIIIWDSSKFGAIHKSKEFVIIPPEAVISVITVKSNCNKSDLIDGLKNLSSLIDLELKYRNRKDSDRNALFKPIHKFFLCFKSESKVGTVLDIVSNYYKILLEKSPEYESYVIEHLKDIDPTKWDTVAESAMKTIFVSMITSLESKEKSFIRGYGPPDDLLGTGVYKHGIRRVPFLYHHKDDITGQFEKFIYHVLSSVYEYLGNYAFSVLAGWSDLHPVYGARIGDSSEIDQERGKELMHYDNKA